MRFASIAVAIAVAAFVSDANALNRQGARAEEPEDAVPRWNVSGYLFAGLFAWNPTYAARPNNTGLALGRFGLHLDIDFFRRYLTLSYDENSFTDGSSVTSISPFAPSEHDHIIGLLSTIPLPHHFALTLAAHFEYDAAWTDPNASYRAQHPDCGPHVMLSPPACYQAGYSQAYVDAYARITYDHGPFVLWAAIGGFVWNPSYAARPDNSGNALLRYVLHGEVRLSSWLSAALDLNAFTDRDENPVVPSELDAVFGLVARWRSLSATVVEEADLNLGRYPANGPNPPSPAPGLNQYYVAVLLQWNFDLHALLHRRPPTPTLPHYPAGSLPAEH